MQLDADVQLTLERMAPTTPGPLGVGLGTTDHDVPFHCSMRVPVGFPLPDPTTAPTAQQSEPLTQVASKSPPPSPPGNGIGTSVHVVPFQASMSGLADDGPGPAEIPQADAHSPTLECVGARRAEQDVIESRSRDGGDVPA